MKTVSDVLTNFLFDVGVRNSFGVLGGGVAPVAGSINNKIKFYNACHETGAAMMACEAYFATNKPTLVLTTTGPGLSNAETGLLAAASEGAKVLCIAGATNTSERGRFAFQETWNETGKIKTFLLESPVQLKRICQEIESAWSGHLGSVFKLLIPSRVQTMEMNENILKTNYYKIDNINKSIVLECAYRILYEDTVMWVGFGARNYSKFIKEIAEKTGMPVLLTPRAKGIFPENHPQFLGITGFYGAHQEPIDYFAQKRPDHLLVLGTKMSEASSCYDKRLLPSKSIIHVDLNNDVFGAAYPNITTLPIQAELGLFLEKLSNSINNSCHKSISPRSISTKQYDYGDNYSGGLISPRKLMESIQKNIVEKSEAIIFSDAGNSFAWANLLLKFDHPNRYRTSTLFAAMTHAVNGSVGSALVSGKKSVAIVGDGAMLMNNELSTAVREKADVLWIVLNDQSYGMVRHGMNSVGMKPFGTSTSEVNFAMLANSMGAQGIVVKDKEKLDEEIIAALNFKGPFVLDVIIDPLEPPPFGNRNSNLKDEAWR